MFEHHLEGLRRIAASKASPEAVEKAVVSWKGLPKKAVRSERLKIYRQDSHIVFAWHGCSEWVTATFGTQEDAEVIEFYYMHDQSEFDLWHSATIRDRKFAKHLKEITAT